jgi:hypothetical protein
MSSSRNWRNAHDSTKLDKNEFSDYKNEMEKMMVDLQEKVHRFQCRMDAENESKREKQVLNELFTRKLNALSKERKFDRKRISENKQAIDKLNKITKPLRRSKRKEEELLAQQDKLFKSGKFDKCKMDRKIYAPLFKKEHPDNIAEWDKYILFTKGGIHNSWFRRLSASSSFFKNHKATPRYIRLFIQRIYNTQVSNRK